MLTMETEDADFEQLAKKSWQSFSTMKRFVSEANRLENASWRLWHMERLRRLHKPAQTPTSPTSTETPTKPNESFADCETLDHERDHSESEAEPAPQVLCVYCEMHRASLSCHGCCHDAYCVSCFKLIHKKGHLATHTAVKIKALSPRERARLAIAAESMATGESHSHSHSHHSLHSLHSGHDDGHDSVYSSGDASDNETGGGHGPLSPSPRLSPTLLSPEGSRHSLVGVGVHKDKPSRSIKAKSWEIQMDMLLQRLMVNSLHSDSDISVHNIDSRRSLGNADSLASFLSDTTNSEDQAAIVQALDEPQTSLPTATTAATATTSSTSEFKHKQLSVDVPPPPAVAEDSNPVPSSPTATVTPSSVASSMASPALQAAVGGLSLESLDSLDTLSSLFPSTLTKTKSRKKNSVCANCNGNHITIDCPLLETSLAAGGGSGSGSGIHSSSLHAGAHSSGTSGSGGVDTVLRKCFTTIHNDNLSNSTHAFLGDEISVRGGGNFSKAQFSSQKSSPGGVGGAWSSFGMNSIAEDQTADVEDTLPVLAGVLDPNALHERHWDSTTWLVSSLATELPLDVFEALRHANKALSSPLGEDDVTASLSGWLHLKQPGSKWRKRFVCLFRNNLWEYLDDKETSRPIGYANLAEGSVHAHQNTEVEFAFRYFRYSSPDSPRDECWMQWETASDAARWREALGVATKLQIEDLFDLRPDAQTASSTTPSDAGYELGHGRFATVRRARRRWRQGQEGKGECCALKIIDKRVFWDLVAHETERDDTVIREILTQTVLTVRAGDAYCPVIRLLSLFETRSWLVMELELMREGDLHEQIVTKSAVSETHAPFLVASLVQAIHFCLQNGVAHRDVKLSNLAIDASSTPKGRTFSVLKLADFGMAAFIQDDGMLKGRCGTPGFVAPEILTAGKGEAYPSGVDMFSVGVVTYTMLCGYEPFFGVNDEELIQMNKAVEYEFEEPEWSSISDEAKDLISLMMEKDTSRRISPQAALQHPFLMDASRALEEAASGDAAFSPPSLRLL